MARNTQVAKGIIVQQEQQGANPKLLHSVDLNNLSLALQALIFGAGSIEQARLSPAVQALLLSAGAVDLSHLSAPVQALLPRWPTKCVSTPAELAQAITDLTGTGGVICLTADIALTSALVLPDGVILTGRGMKGATLTLDTGGSITVGTEAEIRDLKIATTLTSGTLVTISGNKSCLSKVKFLVSMATTVECVAVTGSSNFIFRCIFSGVVGGTATAINYVSGTGNVDENCVLE